MNTRALRRMALHVDEQHRDAMKDLPERLHELHFGSTARALAPSRRRFLSHAAATGAVLTVGGIVLPVSSLVPGAMAQETETTLSVSEEDAGLAVFAASVERAAAAAYEAAAARSLIKEPTLSIAVLFASHHEDHAGAFEGLIAQVTGATESTPSEPNQALLDAFAPQIEAAETAEDLLMIAFTLEQAAAATYQLAMGALESIEAAAIVATIEPVEAQHAVVLGQALDLPMEPDDETSPENWMPAFQSDSDALDPEAYPVS